MFLLYLFIKVIGQIQDSDFAPFDLHCQHCTQTLSIIQYVFVYQKVVALKLSCILVVFHLC